MMNALKARNTTSIFTIIYLCIYLRYYYRVMLRGTDVIQWAVDAMTKQQDDQVLTSQTTDLTDFVQISGWLQVWCRRADEQRVVVIPIGIICT